jgi:vacuolar protein sorting-associated protein VTA1
MAAQLPAKLRTPELQRFATRAAQLEKFKPIVTYWCEYYILQQLLGKNLHTTDDEVANYAVQLMDKLEQTKANNASNDAIVDDVAAKAYVENFALETFSRGDNAQRANAVTKQTADTFMAAATFLDLLSIWGQPDQEITAKSKFAKFHALRIAKAYKAGEDPNATNPVVEEPQQPAYQEDGVDAELKELERQESSRNGSYQAPTVEHAPDDATAPHPLLAQQTPNNNAPPPSAPYQSDNQVSPIEPPTDAAGRQNSIGGGYFPTLSSAPPEPTIPDVGPPAQLPQQPTSPQDFYTSAVPPPAAPSISSFSATTPGDTFTPPSTQASTQLPPFQPVQSPAVPQWQKSALPSAPPPAVAPVPYQLPPATSGFKTDDEATMAASKHARWAISALNFEDVNTAVKELRLALQSLGAG